jgi:hypothetical protein
MSCGGEAIPRLRLRVSASLSRVTRIASGRADEIHCVLISVRARSGSDLAYMRPYRVERDSHCTSGSTRARAGHCQGHWQTERDRLG